jgi:hypothetical protein
MVVAWLHRQLLFFFRNVRVLFKLFLYLRVTAAIARRIRLPLGMMPTL